MRGSARDLGVFALGLRLFLIEDQLVVLGGDDDFLALAQVAPDDFLGHRVLEVFLDGPAHGARSVGGVVALFAQQVPGGLVQIEVEVALGQSFLNLFKFEFEDLGCEYKGFLFAGLMIIDNMLWGGLGHYFQLV